VHCRGFGRAAKRPGMTDLFTGGSISIAVAAVSGSGKPGFLSKASYSSLRNKAGLLVEPPIERFFDICNFWDISACTDVFGANNKEEI